MGVVLAGALLAVLGVAVIVTLRAASASLRDQVRIGQGVLEVLEAQQVGVSAVVQEELRDLQDLVDRLPQRWEEIQREAKRLDGRARYAVARAREELAERGYADERLEDMDRELRIVDGDGSEGGGLQPVRSEMASLPEPDSRAAPSWEDQARAVKFGA